MIQSILLMHFFTIVAGQSPPIQDGDTKQYVLVKLNTERNLTCPFKEVDFYKWNKFKVPTLVLSEQRELKVKMKSFTKSEIYECEAVNGYGQRRATFITKGIDIKSKQFEIDCQSRETGPCFLASGVSNDFDFVVDENTKTEMDCRAVINSTNKATLSYSWKKMSSPDSFDVKLQNSLNNRGMKNSDQFLDNVPSIEKIEYNTIDDMSKWGPLVIFEKVTKDMDGLYQCLVGTPSNSIKRTFRLRVKEIPSISTIEGPLQQTIKATIGSTKTLNCKANSKPKWGKKLDKSEEGPESDEIIKWGGSYYRMLLGTLDNEHKANGGSVKDSKYYVNNLILEDIQQYHSGIYVCSVLTSSTLEHKYVNLTVEAGSGNSEGSKKSNHFPIYIAVPTTVFLICLCTIIYCLVHRRIIQKANFKNRAARGATATTTNSSSGNGSYSGSKNTSNPRHHMLTTTTSSSKGSQNQFAPQTTYSTNMTTVPAYGTNHPTFSSGYTPVVVNYNYTGPGQYVQATNNTPSSTDVEHPCSHHNCMSSVHGHPVPYDSDSTPSPPPPTSIADTSPININNPNVGIMPYSVNSYTPPNPSSQVFISNNQTPHGSSSTSVSSPNAMYSQQAQQQQQPVYPNGVVYTA